MIGAMSVMRALVVTLVFAFAGLLALDLEQAPSSGRAEAAPIQVKPKPRVAAPRTVEVAFHRDGRIVRVQREVPKRVTPAVHALKSLLHGPTRQERAKGIRSAIGDGVRLRSLRKDPGLWRVSFSQALFSAGTPKTVQLRLAQISTTLNALDEPQKYVAISTAGRLATVLRLGARPPAWRPTTGEKGYVYSLRGIQLRMFQLGYLSSASVTGSVDYLTSQALLAFQGWEGLARTGTVTGEVQIELARADRPRPRTRETGKYVEIHRDLGVLLTVENGIVQRAVHTSTGAGGRTPSGSFRVYRKETLSWSVPFSVWMPYASYFIGGIAMHEYSDVPSYPASHGCVRLPDGEAQRVYGFAGYGTPVFVF